MIDLGPCGFFDQDKVVLASALDVLKARGINADTLDHLMNEVR